MVRFLAVSLFSTFAFVSSASAFISFELGNLETIYPSTILFEMPTSPNDKNLILSLESRGADGTWVKAKIKIPQELLANKGFSTKEFMDLIWEFNERSDVRLLVKGETSGSALIGDTHEGTLLNFGFEQTPVGG